MIPAHPNCRCTSLYRGGDAEVDPFEDLDEDIAESIAGSRGLRNIKPLGIGRMSQELIDDAKAILGYRVSEGETVFAKGEFSMADHGLCKQCKRMTTIKNRDGDGWWCRKCQKVVE